MPSRCFHAQCIYGEFLIISVSMRKFREASIESTNSIATLWPITSQRNIGFSWQSPWCRKNWKEDSPNTKWCQLCCPDKNITSTTTSQLLPVHRKENRSVSKEFIFLEARTQTFSCQTKYIFCELERQASKFTSPKSMELLRWQGRILLGWGFESFYSFTEGETIKCAHGYLAVLAYSI